MHAPQSPMTMKLRGVRTAYPVPTKNACAVSALSDRGRARLVRWLVDGVRGFFRNPNMAR